jgi:hypothetical protein
MAYTYVRCANNSPSGLQQYILIPGCACLVVLCFLAFNITGGTCVLPYCYIIMSCTPQLSVLFTEGPGALVLVRIVVETLL